MHLAKGFLELGSVHVPHVPRQRSQLPVLVCGEAQREYRQGYQRSAQQNASLGEVPGITHGVENEITAREAQNER